MIGWVVGIFILLIMLWFLFALCYVGWRYFYWLRANWRIKRNPFPGVTPWRAFWIWRFTRLGSSGDLFRGRHHGGHDEM